MPSVVETAVLSVISSLMWRQREWGIYSEVLILQLVSGLSRSIKFTDQKDYAVFQPSRLLAPIV